MNEYAGREQEIEAREKAAASGEWYDSEGDVFVDGLRIVACMSLSTSRADARFIAHAREDIPYLRTQLGEAREKLCKTCGGSGKVWETGCEATEYLNWTACPDCDLGLLIQAISLVRSAESYDGIMHGATSRRAWEGLDRILHPKEGV